MTSHDSYRAQRVLTATGDSAASGAGVEKAKKRVGSLGKFVQGSFFDDAEEVSTYSGDCMLSST